MLYVSYRNSISALQPSAPTTTMFPQIHSAGVADISTKANETEIQGDPAIVPLVDDGFHSDEKHSNDPDGMLEDLRKFIESMNGRLEKGWEVIRKRRPSNPHVFEKIYISPDKQKFRSRLAVARFLGISEKIQRESTTNVQPAAQRVRSRYAFVEHIVIFLLPDTMRVIVAVFCFTFERNFGMPAYPAIIFNLDFLQELPFDDHYLRLWK